MSVDNVLGGSSLASSPPGYVNADDVEVIYRDSACAPLLGLSAFLSHMSLSMRVPPDSPDASALRRMGEASARMPRLDASDPSTVPTPRTNRKALTTTDKSVDLALYAACEQDNAAVAKDLLERRHKSIQLKNNHVIERAIQVAAVFGACKSLDVLLKCALSTERGVRCLNALSQAGDPPLHIAFNCGHTSVVSALLNYGADANIQNSANETLTRLAARSGNTEVLLLLERCEADMTLTARDGMSPMHVAAKFGQTEAIRLLHAKGLAIDVKDMSGRTPMHHAVAVRCVAQMRDTLAVLVELGADLNAVEDVAQLTPLHLAVQTGNLAVIGELVRLGARCDVRSSENLTPMELAQKMERMQVMRRFIRLGVTAQKPLIYEQLPENLRDQLFPNKTPFVGLFECSTRDKRGAGRRIGDASIKALLCKDRETIKPALRTWFDTVDELATSMTGQQYQDLSGLALRIYKYSAGEDASLHPMLAAAKCDDFPAVLLMASWLESFDVGLDVTGVLPRLALRSGDLGLVSALYKADARLFRRFEAEGGNALHLAAQDGTPAIIDFLLSDGILRTFALNKKNNDGQTPLELAIEADRNDTFETLLASGAKSSISDQFAVQPIHLAAAAGATSILESMLADKNTLKMVNQPMSGGETPLHVASERGHTQAVAILLRHGANPHLCDYDRETAAIAAAREGHNGVLRALHKAGGDNSVLLQPRDTLSRETPAHMAAYFGNTDTLRLLKQLGVPMDGVDGGGRTLAHYAVSNLKAANVSATLGVLDGLGAQLDQQDREGLRPLHIAVAQGIPAAVRTLIQFGAQVGSRSTLGYTPLDYAALYNMHASADQLIINGGQVNKNLPEGFNTVDVAQRARSREFLRTLHRHFRGL